MVFAYESAFVGHSGEPRTFAKSQTRPDALEWRIAALDELAAHQRNDTWELVECPPGVGPISSRWVLKVKTTIDGEIDRYKARLVARGYTQRSGIDFFETFAPTCRIQSIRAVLALAASMGLVLRAIDISNAFLNGDIDVDIYMSQPEGFVLGKSSLVCKLRKAIYGTKQAARMWKAKLQAMLLEPGFTCVISDGSLYLYQRDGDFIALPFYVDDGLLGGSSDALLDFIIEGLCERLTLRDLGTAEHILGVKITRTADLTDISISQRQYVVEMLDRFSMSDCKSVLTPMVPGIRLSVAVSAGSCPILDLSTGRPSFTSCAICRVLGTLASPIAALSSTLRTSSSPTLMPIMLATQTNVDPPAVMLFSSLVAPFLGLLAFSQSSHSLPLKLSSSLLLRPARRSSGCANFWGTLASLSAVRLLCLWTTRCHGGVQESGASWSDEAHRASPLLALRPG